jgi:hypothetical protein
MSAHESAAMWKSYLKSNEGIAVQSTYANLRDSIIDDERVSLGVVKYIDYEIESFVTGDLITPFIYKRKSFEHEQELRALVVKVSKEKKKKKKKLDFSKETIDRGLEIRVDLKCLIRKIYVAPSAPDWFADVVKRVVRRYNYEFEVVHSKLDEQPLF